MDYLDTRTVMWDVWHSTCVSTGDATDVVFVRDGTYSAAEPLGFAPCPQWYTPNVLCNSAWVIVYQAGHYVTTGTCGGGQAMYDGNMITSIRHELGHTVGLYHYPPAVPLCSPPTAASGDDAMISDWTPASTNWHDYNDYHKGLIDGHY
jgi:hypothetical protein